MTLHVPSVISEAYQRLAVQIERLPKFLVALFLAIIVSGFLTYLSIFLYIRDGVASIDLSRPGYDNLRKNIQDNSTNSSFSSTGDLTRSTLDTFTTLYTKQSNKLPDTGSFADGALDDANLNLSETEATPRQ